MFLRRISEVNNNNDKSKIARGKGGHQIRTMTNKGERGVKKSNILPDVLCEWPLSVFALV